MFTSKDLKELLKRGGTIKLVLFNDYGDYALSNELEAVTPLDDGSVRLRWHLGVINPISPLKRGALLGARNNILSIIDYLPGIISTSEYDLSVEMVYDY